MGNSSARVNSSVEVKVDLSIDDFRAILMCVESRRVDQLGFLRVSIGEVII